MFRMERWAWERSGARAVRDAGDGDGCSESVDDDSDGADGVFRCPDP